MLFLLLWYQSFLTICEEEEVFLFEPEQFVWLILIHTNYSRLTVFQKRV